VDLVTEDVAVIHLYTMNNANTAHSMHESISSLFTI
ncbi:methylenetetrahydrofolate reductase [NAD(P)H], partial [Lactococcus lactis]|nr:methylenetetrahydrofolate reductase [NAD(P)H] [Lactococcus lactis]